MRRKVSQYVRRFHELHTMFIINLQKLQLKTASIRVVSENRFVGPVNLCSYDITKKCMSQLLDQWE